MTVLVKLLSQFSPSNDGAFFFWILAIFGLLAFSLAIERLLTVNIKSNIDAEKFSSDVRAMIQKGDLKNAHELAKANSEKALAYVYSRALQVAVGMEYIDYRNIQNAVDEATLEIMPRLTKRTSWLQTFANVAGEQCSQSGRSQNADCVRLSNRGELKRVSRHEIAR